MSDIEILRKALLRAQSDWERACGLLDRKRDELADAQFAADEANIAVRRASKDLKELRGY